MIDKNGKLFGKINIIDLLIILVIVAAAAFLASKFLGGSDGAANSSKTKVAIEFYVNSAPAGIGDSLEAGTAAYEDSTENGFGKVTEFSSEPAYTYEAGKDGETVKVPNIGYDFLYVTVEVEGELLEDGIKLDGKLYSVGAAYTMHFGKVMQYSKITSITPVE